LKDFTNKDWEEITTEVFNQVFKKSPVKRTKLEGLKRNIDFIGWNEIEKIISFISNILFILFKIIQLC
jgi:epoxyqueuosine reductase